MAPSSVAERASAAARTVSPATAFSRPAGDSHPNAAGANSASAARTVAKRPPGRNATDDEILGLRSAREDSADAARNSNDSSSDGQLGFDFDAPTLYETGSDARQNPERRQHGADGDANSEPDNLRAVFEANPDLRRDWHDANAYREAFATPEDARAATALLSDLNRMDSLFFSNRAEDHAEHQRAIVSLIAGRARQALPAVAKRVLNEWTSTVVAANQDRRARQRAAERRVDIAGSSGGSQGHRPASPRDIDYARMSDSDILNL